MTPENWLQQQNEQLLAIAIQAKRLLLSNEIDNSGRITPEIDRLAELIERYEAEHSEIEPKLKPFNKKAWFANLSEPGQVAGLSEILALSGQGNINSKES